MGGALDHHPAFLVAGVAFLVALAGTVLPWSAPNYSHFTGLFGGWGFSPLAWSIVAALSATAGLALWTTAAVSPPAHASWTWALPWVAGLCAAGSMLFLVWPPFATHPWLGPWITLFAAAVALALSLWAAMEVRRTRAASP
jgi:hypothetical protein